MGFCVKESHGLLENLGVNVVSEVCNARETDVLNQRYAKEFGKTLGAKKKDQRESKHGPNVVNTRRNERIEEDRVMTAPRNRKQGETLIRRARRQDHVDGRPDRQDDETIDSRHECKQDYSGDQKREMRRHVSEQPAEFILLRQPSFRFHAQTFQGENLISWLRSCATKPPTYRGRDGRPSLRIPSFANRGEPLQQAQRNGAFPPCTRTRRSGSSFLR